MPQARSSPATATPHDDAPGPTTRRPRRAEGAGAGATPLSSAAAPKESAKDRRAREAREREAKDRDAQLAAAALVPPQTGTVKMAISPWGQVEVDGAPSGASPPLTELKLAEGRHQIVVRNGDFAPYSASVNVVGGQVVSLRYKFGS